MVEIRTISLPVTLPKGFDECGRCVGRLHDALLQIPGLESVDVDLDESTLTISYDPFLTSLEDVRKRADLIGIRLRERFLHETLTLIGLDCPDCAMKLEKAVCRLHGVVWVSVNFAAGRMSVEYESAKVESSAMIRIVKGMGYGVAGADEAGVPQLGRWHVNKQTVLTVTAGIAIGLALVMGAQGYSVASRVLYAFALVSGGIYAARGAFFSLKSLVLDMNVLMSLASIGAAVMGEWFDGAMVMFLFSLGNALEARTVEKSRQAVRSLVNLFPTEARVLRDGIEVVVLIGEVKVGEVFVVRPGDKIATDGVVKSGSSTVNQASVTGESVPVEKNVDDKVFAGSINERGALEVTATATADDNTLAKILHLVEEAQAEKAPSQRFTEKFGRSYTPIVIGLAVAVAVIPPLLFHAPFQKALHMALTLLVVSCPCALVISTPVTIVSAIGNAARNGVMIKGGTHLESAGAVDVVAFDKTGTITTGRSSVTDVVADEGYTEDDVVALAASVESRSEHPLAQAVLREASARGLALRDVADFEALTGMGAAAKFGDETAVVGNTRLMDQLDIDFSRWRGRLDKLQGQGKTAILVAHGRRLAGVIALQDTLRDSAKEAIVQLRRAGMRRLVMITGDNEAAAKAVSVELGIDEYHAELLPKDKVDVVRGLIERFGSRVAFVGDGVNDAPALAAATVGIAMGAAGSDTALETADIALMADDLSKLPYTIRLSRKALRTVKQNIGFALVVIGVLISASLLGHLTLSLGVLGHEGSALIVIANSIRMMKYR